MRKEEGIRALIGFRNGLIISIVMWIIFWAVSAFAEVKKIDDYTFEVDIPVQADLKQYKQLKTSLEANITQKENEIAQLQEQIAKMEANIVDAESKGVKEKIKDN